MGPGRRRSRLRRLLQPIEGDADRFSSARSFAPPAGARVGSPDRPRGYHIDLSQKANAPHWPPPWLAAPDQQLHVATVQWALGAWERYVAGEGEAWRTAALAGAEQLLAAQQRGGTHDGAWLQWFAMPHTYRVDPPWASAITQGEGASLFVRLHLETGDERYAEAARRALAPLRTPTSAGGLLAERDGMAFFEEYPTRPASLVLNGGIFALWGVRDVARGLADGEAAALYDVGLEGLAGLLPAYDTGHWSRYDLYPHPIANVASGAYHLLHITQLSVLAKLEPRPEFERALERFEAYRRSAADRLRASATKVAFRLISPRSPSIARALPWAAGRGRRRFGEDLIVLCYHGVSEDWDPGLAVSSSQLEQQVRLLLARGYRAATFSEAVLGPRTARTFAVTFDDAYASVGRLAAPLLGRLGVPATVFVPTGFPASGAPLSWPGTEHWLGGPHEGELSALSWDQLAELADSGWEIGSHTRSHPRLTELSDAELAAELRDSRAECERRLGRDCVSLAYPYGDVDRRVMHAAAAAGYGAACTLPPPDLGTSALSWPRVGVYGGDRERRFRLKVSPTVRKLRRGPVLALLAKLRRPGRQAAAS